MATETDVFAAVRKPEAISGGVCPGSDYTDEEREFLAAMDRYRREKRRPFPTVCEFLGVLKALGYRKVESPS